MRIKDFKKIKKELKPKEIINLYCRGEVYLTDKQLSVILDLKNKEGRK